MAPAPVKRKLAAILAADAVSYSRLMAADEEGTMKVLSAHRAVIDGIIEFHEGRIINTAGDSVLAEFASPTEAVRCAVEIQDALKTRNDSLPEDRRLYFRIGVNLGDVMVKGNDLLGDGVNVAARLEGIAEPGNIYVSSSVYDQIAGKLDLGFVDLGDQSLKNIDRPIRAYRVDREGRRMTAATPRRGAGVWIAGALGAVVVAGGIAWYLTQISAARQEEEAKVKMAAEHAKARLEAEEAKRKAAANAEIAKARAEAEDAKRRAESETAAALQTRRALEEQRAADARSRAQAELAQARADADAMRRKADAELAAAAESRRAAEAAAAARTASVGARRYQGPWMAVFDCPEFRGMPAASIKVPITVSGDAFELQHRVRDQPGSFNMRGVPNHDGRLQLAGGGYSGFKNTYGRPYPTAFDGRFAGEHYEGKGNLGTRECALTIARSAAQPTSFLQGQWAARFSCAAFEGEQARTFTATVSVAGETFELRTGKRDQPGWLQVSGVPQADGRLRLSGSGLSRHENYRGKPYAATFEGKLSGERYEGNGRLGRRDCALTMARK